MADQNKNQSNQNRQGGQQSPQRKQGSGTDDTYRAQDEGQNQPGQARNQQGERSRIGEGQSMVDEELGGGTRREPAETAHDRGVGSERRNVKDTDRESLKREGLESETDIEDVDIDESSER